ncbi:TPA: NlpC/P60 family protein, partial [Clostridioides difficile]|nr:NlpC/P60 family protein [Clostridioides difficile]HBG7800824.1 C40 family peptidase [Clostridioides difficile]HBN6117824.1 C40 family peptidase [Clostridioides difficile]HBN6217282.1 C40 family peptidase [Clostridioides difficile]HBY2642275.1 C40 family peptidase [Clostridioides difficile]
QAGDLVFFHNPVSHVGLYIGNGEYLHAPQTGDVVKISKLSGRKDFNTARRVL